MYPNRKHIARNFVSDIGARKPSEINTEYLYMKNYIKKLRLNADLSQQRLAEEIGGGCTKATIQKLESGTMGLTTEWMARIAKALKCSPCELIDDNYKNNQMRASEAAIVFVLKEIISIILNRKKPTKKTLIDDLGFALEHYRQEKIPDAILVMASLLAHIRDEKPPEQQQVAHKILKLSPPQ